MDESNVKNVVEAAKELGEAYEETAYLLSDFTEGVQVAGDLYGPGEKGTGATLISLGVALIAFPEPTLVSDVVGCGIVAAGFAYQRFIPPPLSVDDIFSSIEDQVKELRSSGQRITDEMGLPINHNIVKPFINE